MDTTFLVNFLELVQYIQNNDKENALEIVKIINGYTLEEDQITQLKDYFRNANDNIEILTIVINNLVIFKNKQSLIKIVELRRAKLLGKEELENILNTEYSFDDNRDKYLFYSIIVRLVTFLSEPELLKLAINKLQSL